MKTLRESNVEKLNASLVENSKYSKLRESIKRTTGWDISDEKQFPVEKIDWKKLHDKFSEADSTTGFVQLLRAGINNIANSAYQSVETTFEDWSTIATSDKIEELYAPLQGITFPREVSPQQKYPQVRAAGLDIKLRARKFGSLYPVELELEKFDQTGQIIQNGGRLLGEYLKLVMEVYHYGKLASPSGGATYQQLSIPVSETKPADESTYPWSQALVGGGANRPATFTLLDQNSIQAADIALMNQKNLLGIKMEAKGTRLIVSPRDKFKAAVLLNSSFFPTAQTTGTGTFNSINPIKGLYDLTVSRYMFNNSGSADANSAAWYMVDGSKPWFVAHVNEAAVIEQEARNSGESFERDIIRFKGRTMFNCDFIDPRFAYQGNDGSVTS